MDFIDTTTLSALGHALGIILAPERLVFLVFGVLVGLALGLIPGIGGLTGFALLVPFTYKMDPYAAFGMLLGMHSVIATADSVTSILFGVPGHSSQATVLDGLQMTKKGQGSRALSAAYMSSLLGGLIGAGVVAIALPFLRPVVLLIATPEMLALTVFGIAMVSALSGNAPLKGVVAACFGVLIGMIGINAQTGQTRWTGDLLYLQDGIPLVPIILGIFALPELCDLAISRTSIAGNAPATPSRTGMRQGVVDTLRNWFLVLRCSGLGAFLGMIPGITGAVTDWIVYGHAMQTTKGAKETFTKGDVRGVIAPESANNAREGGMLVPMLAFGLPGGAVQAILLGAMMVHGFTPGPDILTKHLDLAFTMVWSIAIANIFGAGLCFLLSGQFAKIAKLRYSVILAVVMPIVYIGAYEGSHSWGDMFVLLIFGVIGMVMKRLKWARPPLVLGLVLGTLLERYMSISFMRYQSEWLLRPGVIVLLVLSALIFFKPMLQLLRQRGSSLLRPSGKVSFKAEDLVYLFFMGVAVYALVTAQEWNFLAKVGPMAVASVIIVAATVSLVYKVFFALPPAAAGGDGSLHMDVGNDDGELPSKVVFARAARFFGWFVAFLVGTALIGMLPTIPLIMLAFMRVEGREPWRLSIVMAVCMTVFVYVVFDQIIHVHWPANLLGSWLWPVNPGS